MHFCSQLPAAMMRSHRRQHNHNKARSAHLSSFLLSIRLSSLLVFLLVVAPCYRGAEGWVATTTTGTITARASFAGTAGRCGSSWKRGTTVRRPKSTTTRLNMVVSITLTSISDDHERVGEEMKGSIRRWLDDEWMEQEVHARMGECVKRSYVKSRAAGHDDLMTVFVQVADDLEASWQEFDQDAFVGNWDVANYVSDYLTALTGSERCECSSKIH